MSQKPLPPLSASQQAAVDHPFADALVTAGAGSGKTRVLSERFVHLVDGKHVALRRLASLTFTEKAAAQMRARIADLFLRKGDEQSRADVEFAPISTIHAFCALLLRQHAIEAGVDPAFRVLDGVESELLLSDAAEMAENRIATTHPELFDAYALLRGESRDELIKLLRELRGAGTAVRDVAWKSGEGVEQAATLDVEEAVEVFAQVGEHLGDERQGAFADALRQVADVLGALRENKADIAPFLGIAAHAAVVALKGPRKHAYTKPRTRLEVTLLALVGCLLDRWGAEVFLPALTQILTLYDEAYAERKRDESALDFTDLELGARDVLQRAEADGRPLDLAPLGLLVDEFQDTNPLQAEILGLLRAQAPQFSVGDPKQSIYRFRRADVRVMLHEQTRVGADACHPMNASYRACEELVAGINVLNEHLFAGGAGGVPYEPLLAAATYLPATQPPVEVAIIDAGSDSNVSEARTLEAAWIADRIAQLTDGSQPRLRMNEAGESVGALKPGDIAILVRARKPLEAYEQALEARGIPYLTQTSVGFFQAEEILDLIDVLRVVHNPGDLHALACTASGPAMGAGSGEPMRWFSKGETPPWERMVAEAAAGGRHAETIRCLQRMRTEAVCGSLARAVEMALHDLGLLDAALLLSAGDRRAANLRKAVAFARQLDQSGRRGLGDLLRHLETLRTREMKESEAAVGGEAANVVRLTTVHSSKGLEYPVVFVADVGYAARGDTPSIAFDGTRNIAARITDPLGGGVATPGGYTLIQETHKKEAEQEALRLLYVATTRAEERLILSGSCVGKTKPGAPKRYAGWGKRLWEVLGTPFEHGSQPLPMQSPTTEEATQLAFSIVDGSELEVRRAGDKSTPHVSPTPAVLEEARARIQAVDTAVPTLGNTRYVVSVSELLTFAESPQAYYRERVVGAGARASAASDWDQPSSDDDEPSTPREEAARRMERRLAWDEPSDIDGSLDRAAVGRAVHAVIDGLMTEEHVPAELVAEAVREEGGGAAMHAAVLQMSERFLRSEVGSALREALEAGRDVRREVDFHARIRFPGGEPVAGFDSLLVKGSIDLWLPTEDGIRLIDHKTNRAGGRYRSPDDLATHYAWQLRLYALAAERLLGEDVASASLLLLDDGWGAQALDVAIDISGPSLEETRRLCRAFACSELEGRYPTDWRSLLD